MQLTVLAVAAAAAAADKMPKKVQIFPTLLLVVSILAPTLEVMPAVAEVEAEVQEQAARVAQVAIRAAVRLGHISGTTEQMPKL